MSLRSRLLALPVAAAALLAAPGIASAGLVNNGDFETGTLSGWQTSNTTLGEWLVYTGTNVEVFTVPAPPQGTHAAVTVQQEESRQILYQDVTLPPGGSVNQLSLFAYYVSQDSIFSPDTLSIDVPNQQYRIDVMKPGAPIDSVAPGDILATVFRTVTGDPQELGPTIKTTDLSAFAGQTVRLRFAVAVTDNELNAGVDAVSIASNGFSIGKAALNKKKGTARIPVTVPDAGSLKVSGNGVSGKAKLASKAVQVSGGGTVTLLIRPSGKTKGKLNETGKAKVKAAITYKPTGVTANTEKTKIKLKKKS
jgi:hypothetical protein